MSNISFHRDKILKCAMCENILSVPPILIISKDGKKQKCGRCQDISVPASIRNVGYEKIAKHTSFPCTFKDCKEVIPWSAVSDHEKKCPHRCVRCPICWENCKFTIKIKNFQHHFTVYHKKNVLYDEIPQREFDRNNVFLLIKDNVLFLVYALASMRLQKMFFSIFTIEPTAQNYTFNVVLTSKRKPDIQISITNQPVVLYEERIHCYRCLRRECTLKHHRYSLTDDQKEGDIFKNMTTRTHHNVIRSLLHSVTMDFAITVTGNNSPIDKSIATYKSDTNLYRECVECPVCKEYLRAQAFICQTGHTICGTCKPKLSCCPLCKEAIRDTRNFSLESIVRCVKLPCMYENNGCKFVGIISDVHTHELECRFEDFS